MAITLEKQSIEALQEKVERFLWDKIPENPGEGKRFIRFTVPLERLDPLEWLLRQENPRKIYWRSRESTFAMAGAGEADCIAEENPLADITGFFNRLGRALLNAPPEMRYYGGIRFNPARSADPAWEPFGVARFAVPRFECYAAGKKTWFACNFLLDPAENWRSRAESVLKEFKELNWEGLPAFPEAPALLSRSDLPAREGWRENVLTALALIEQRRVEKIVLARQSTLRFSPPFAGVDMLRRLQMADQRVFYFCFQLSPRRAFIGATPERLYRRDGREIFSEAVAGTRPRGNSRGVDQKYYRELLHSEKDIREHRFVLDSILASFRQLCRTVEASETLSVLKLANVQHLYSRVRGILEPGADDGRILSLLHPTPAVGGFPKSAALREIDALEPFDRGWYAGPVGWISAGAAEFAVAIRSGLVEDERIHLFAGAGIVPGSSPEKEWQEIESKIGNFVK